MAESLRARAKRLGVHHSTLYYRENPEALERKREYDRERQRPLNGSRYWNQSGVEYNRELLRKRRQKALQRMARRKARKPGR